MNLSKQILIVEIKTIEGNDFDPQQLPKMVVYQDTKDKYHIYKGIERIETAIAQVIPRLSSAAHSRSSSSNDDWDASRPHRHPLLFDVQVFENEFEACLASIENSQNKLTRKRR